MSFAADLGNRTKEGVRKRDEEYERVVAPWRAQVAELVQMAKNQCFATADAGDNQVDVVLVDNTSKLSSTFSYGVNNSRCIEQLSFIQEEVKVALAAMGFTKVEVSTKYVPGRFHHQLFAALEWGVPENVKASAGRCRGNLVLPCGVCSEQHPAVCLVPCGHLVCANCAEINMCTCPFCRTSVSACQAVFQS